MTKKLDANKLISSGRKEFLKPENAMIPNVDSIVERIHRPADEKEKKETIVKASIEMPKSLHKQVCQRALDKELTIKDYFIGLVKQDLATE